VVERRLDAPSLDAQHGDRIGARHFELHRALAPHGQHQAASVVRQPPALHRVVVEIDSRARCGGRLKIMASIEGIRR
jgi:hypothetical protein